MEGDEGPSLAVRLVQVASEFELERKRERQRLQTSLRKLEETNQELTQKGWTKDSEIESLRAEVGRLTAAVEEARSRADARAVTVSRELVTSRFELAERTNCLAGLRLVTDPAHARQLLAKATEEALGHASGDRGSARDRPGVPGAEDGENTNPAGSLLASNGATVCVLAGDATTLRRLQAILEQDRRRALAFAGAREKPSVEGGRAAAGTPWLWFSRESLNAAAEAGDELLVRRVLEPHTVASGTPAGGDTAALEPVLADALRRACRTGQLGIVRLLTQMGASVSARSEDDSLWLTPLHLAAAGGHEALVKFILGREADLVNATDVRLRTPLHLAVAGNHASVIRALLLQGADPTLADESGATPDSLAAAMAGETPIVASGKRPGDKTPVPAPTAASSSSSSSSSSSVALRTLRDASALFWNASVRANRHYSEKRFEDAIAAYSVAIECASGTSPTVSPRDLATLHYNRARAAYRLGRHVAAVEDCATALTHDPTYRNALAQRAECHMCLFDFERAVRDFQGLLDSDPTDTQWARRLADARSMRDLDHYQILGVSRDASPTMLKKAYRNVCLKWHPDKHTTSPEASHRANLVFRRITTAFEILTDSYKKMVYDMEQRVSSLGLGGIGTGGASGAAGGPEAFDRWFAKEKERDEERMRERERTLAAEAARKEELERKRRSARAELDRKEREKEREREAQRDRDRPHHGGPSSHAASAGVAGVTGPTPSSSTSSTSSSSSSSATHPSLRVTAPSAASATPTPTPSSTAAASLPTPTPASSAPYVASVPTPTPTPAPPAPAAAAAAALTAKPATKTESSSSPSPSAEWEARRRQVQEMREAQERARVAMARAEEFVRRAEESSGGVGPPGTGSAQAARGGEFDHEDEDDEEEDDEEEDDEDEEDEFYVPPPRATGSSARERRFEARHPDEEDAEDSADGIEEDEEDDDDEEEEEDGADDDVDLQAMAQRMKAAREASESTAQLLERMEARARAQAAIHRAKTALAEDPGDEEDDEVDEDEDDEGGEAAAGGSGAPRPTKSASPTAPAGKTSGPSTSAPVGATAATAATGAATTTAAPVAPAATTSTASKTLSPTAAAFPALHAAAMRAGARWAAPTSQSQAQSGGYGVESTKPGARAPLERSFAGLGGEGDHDHDHEDDEEEDDEEDEGGEEEEDGGVRAGGALGSGPHGASTRSLRHASDVNQMISGLLDLSRAFNLNLDDVLLGANMATAGTHRGGVPLRATASAGSAAFRHHGVEAEPGAEHDDEDDFEGDEDEDEDEEFDEFGEDDGEEGVARGVHGGRGVGGEDDEEGEGEDDDDFDDDFADEFGEDERKHGSSSRTGASASDDAVLREVEAMYVKERERVRQRLQSESARLAARIDAMAKGGPGSASTTATAPVGGEAAPEAKDAAGSR